MRKVLKINGVSNKKFRLLILKTMKNNIDELIKATNIVEKELTKVFVNYRADIIRQFISVDSDKNDKYINKYLHEIKKYEKIRRRELQNTMCKFSKNDQERKYEEKEQHLNELNTRIYFIDSKWKTQLSNILKYGPRSENSFCTKVKNNLKSNMSEELANVMELLPERIINAIILQKFKVFRNHIVLLLTKDYKNALENYPLIDVHVTLNKLCLGYVKFNYSEDKSLNCYIGYKKNSELYPYERDRYNFKIGMYDQETIYNINNEQIDMIDITENEQFEVYISKEGKDDTYILFVNHGIRKQYEDIVVDDDCIILRSNDSTNYLECVSDDKVTFIDDEIKEIIDNLSNNYIGLENVINTISKLNIKSPDYIPTNKLLRDKIRQIELNYLDISAKLAINIENECKKRNSNLLILYYIPENNFPLNQVCINGKVIRPLLKYLSEKGIETILINQFDRKLTIFKDFKYANYCDDSKFHEINKYIIDKIKEIDFTSDILDKIQRNNASILKSDKSNIDLIMHINGKNYNL